MIISSNQIAQMGVGAQGAIPEEADARVHLPSVILPAVLFTTTLQVDVPAATAQDISFLENNQVVHTNAAGTQVDICILDRGLWEIVINATAWFNYVSAGAGADFLNLRMRSVSSGVLHPLMSFVAQTGQFINSIGFRCLLQSQHAIQRQTPTNGVGQTIQASFTVIANKII